VDHRKSYCGKEVAPHRCGTADNPCVQFRKFIASMLAFLLLFAAVASGAGIGPASPEHHETHALAHGGAVHDGTAPAHFADGGASTDSSSDRDCSSAPQGCCPGFAAVLPVACGVLVSDSGGTRAAFAPKLRLLSRVEGIYKPPWFNA
jgi:hypothetical protein